MTDTITLQAHRIGALEDITRGALEDLGPSGDNAVSAICIDCISGPHRPDLSITALARHGYYTSTDKQNYFARHLKFVHADHRTRAAVAGTLLLSDALVPVHIHELRALTAIPDINAGEVKYRFVQMQKCSILLRFCTDMDAEMETLQEQGRDVDAWVAGLASIAFPPGSLSGHEMLQTMKIASHIIRNHAADNAANTRAEVYGDLCNATLNIIPPPHQDE